MKIQEIIKIKSYPYYTLDLHDIDFAAEIDKDIEEFCIWLSGADVVSVSFRSHRLATSECVDLSSLNAEVIVRILAAIAANPKIEELDLSCCNLGSIYNPDILKAMFDALSQKAFTKVSVAKNRLGVASMQQLAMWASVNTRKLYLSENPLGSADADAFGHLLFAAYANEKLYELYLDSCELGCALYSAHIINCITHPTLSAEAIEELRLTEQAKMKELWVEFISISVLSRLDISCNEFPKWFSDEILKIRNEHNPDLRLGVDEYRYEMTLAV